jgi:uncharacterized protein YndB with AHSA1/START domain
MDRAHRSDTSDREIVTSRLLDAPRELVFEAWTDPKQVVQWWGPHGFTTTTNERSVTPGGVWRFVMHGPDGRDYQNRIAFVEVVKPERLVYHHSGEGDMAHVRFDVTVTFEAKGGKTLLTMRSIFATAQERDGAAKFGAVEGARQTLERLAQHLEKR